ncbi:MAG TPA: hypothetical protein VGO71_02990 [Baekduia sp.]|nr:hypothetical protein [Baekduia sp.]
MSRTAAATREDVVAAAARRFVAGERIDVQAVVAEAGVARATAIIRLTEAFLYNDAAAGLRGDSERLRDVLAALLGVAGG